MQITLNREITSPVNILPTALICLEQFNTKTDPTRSSCGTGLADPLFWKPDNVQVLLGAGACAQILETFMFKMDERLLEQENKFIHSFILFIY